MRTPRTIPAAELERTWVVANNAMNRERGLSGVNSYARELGRDPLETLAGRPAPSWLDLCSGEGRALRAAAAVLPPDAVLTGVDLVGPTVPAPLPPGLELVTASVSAWAPDRTYHLITCVHGLHYVGDQLGLLARAAAWLAPDGLLLAHFDPGLIRWADGSPAGRAALAALRAAGFAYSPARSLLTLEGSRRPVLAFRYLGADPDVGPGCTGQPAVGSLYAPAAGDAG
ncbi:methyltransferase domain-containing protein [Streptomyces sp. NPDC047130]|uniref:methyltransferase domain-containing protein n=1 Tax=Streptomyces sp. NPDC047130 TaxID=3155261 RepID=UPI0033E0C494